MRQLLLMIMLMILTGCSAMGSRTLPAPVEEPGQVVDKSVAVPSPPPATTIERAPKPYSLPPPSGSALNKLRLAALSQQRAGKYGRAAATLERAIRISPRDAMLWHQLASVRLEQQKWRLAINMAAKSNALAADKPPLQRKNWLIMARAYRALGQTSKARDAMQRAR